MRDMPFFERLAGQRLPGFGFLKEAWYQWDMNEVRMDTETKAAQIAARAAGWRALCMAVLT
jgi:hypothetical protein